MSEALQPAACSLRLQACWPLLPPGVCQPIVCVTPAGTGTSFVAVGRLLAVARQTRNLHGVCRLQGDLQLFRDTGVMANHRVRAVGLGAGLV